MNERAATPARTAKLDPRTSYSLQPEVFRLRYGIVARKMNVALRTRHRVSDVHPPSASLILHIHLLGRDLDVLLPDDVRAALADAPVDRAPFDEVIELVHGICSDAKELRPPPGSTKPKRLDFIKKREAPTESEIPPALADRVRASLDAVIIPSTAVIGLGAQLELDVIAKQAITVASLEGRITKKLGAGPHGDRTDYNLACLWAGASEHIAAGALGGNTTERTDEHDLAVRRSFEALRRCLITAPPNDAGLFASAAAGDSSLKALRDDPVFGPRANALIGALAHETVGGAATLDALDAIGPFGAAALAKAHITSVDDVPERLDARSLASVCEVAESLAAAWVGAIHLLQAGVPDADSVNLLGRHDVTTPAALVAADVVAMRTAMTAAKEASPPTEEALDHWVMAAKRWIAAHPDEA